MPRKTWLDRLSRSLDSTPKPRDLVKLTTGSAVTQESIILLYGGAAFLRTVDSSGGRTYEGSPRWGLLTGGTIAIFALIASWI